MGRATTEVVGDRMILRFGQEVPAGWFRLSPPAPCEYFMVGRPLQDGTFWLDTTASLQHGFRPVPCSYDINTNQVRWVPTETLRVWTAVYAIERATRRALVPFGWVLLRFACWLARREFDPRGFTLRGAAIALSREEAGV